MKKLLVIVLLILILLVSVASSIEAAILYTCRLAVTSTSSANLTNVPFVGLMSNSTLASNGFINNNGLDVKVLDGITALQSMLASDRTMVIGNVLANSTKTLSYTTGNAPASSMPIILGVNGSIATLENAALELGSNFSVTIIGYIDTSAASLVSPLYKQHAIKIYVSGVGSITAATLDVSDAIVLSDTVGGVSSGLHTIVVSGDGVHFSLQIDAGAPTTVGIGSGVPSSTYSYIWDQGSNISYISSIVIVVGGVEKLKYRPISILSSTGSTAILPDIDNTQNGTITWGASAARVTVSVGSMIAVTTVVTPTPPVPSAPAVISGITAGPGPTPTPVSSNFPLYGIFAVMGSLLHVDTNVMLNIGLIFIIVALGIMCLIARLEPIFTGGFYIIIYIIFNFFGIADYWQVFMMITFVFLTWMLPRQTAVL